MLVLKFLNYFGVETKKLGILSLKNFKVLFKIMSTEYLNYLEIRQFNGRCHDERTSMYRLRFWF